MPRHYRVSTTALIAAAVSLIMLGFAGIALSPVEATPLYAQQTHLACGQCHVNPAGGGPRNAFGEAFAKNGHKLPPKQ